jgi:hypothetical protein
MRSLCGGDASSAGLNNKTLFKFVAQGHNEPSQLRGRKSVANFGGLNELAVVLALKE